MVRLEYEYGRTLLWRKEKNRKGLKNREADSTDIGKKRPSVISFYRQRGRERTCKEGGDQGSRCFAFVLNPSLKAMKKPRRKRTGEEGKEKRG